MRKNKDKCINKGIHTYIHTHMHVYIHTYMHVCIHTYIHACMHTYIHTYIHTCIHTYMYKYIHTYMYKYIHTCRYKHIPCFLSQLKQKHRIRLRCVGIYLRLRQYLWGILYSVTKNLPKYLLRQLGIISINSISDDS